MLEFHPELLEAKGTAQAALEDAGIVWLTDYSACDLVHEDYGLEFEGFKDERSAQAALKVLRPLFPEWTRGWVWYCELYHAEWCLALTKYPRFSR